MRRRVLIAMLATAMLLPVLAGVIVYSLLTGGTSSGGVDFTPSNLAHDLRVALRTNE